MTRQELILIGGDKVRRDESLILSYLEEFEKMFGYKPNCAGCSFRADWKKFSNGSITITQNLITMKTDKTFELKRGQKHVIHTYKIGNRPRRSYGNTMTEEFAIAFLTNGTKEQIAERKKIFDILPQIGKVIEVSEIDSKPKETTELLTINVYGEEILLSETTHKQLNAYAEANGIDFGDATKVAEKREVIANG